MRNNALRLMQGLRAAGALREAARTSMGTSMSAARFLSVLSSSAVTVPAQFGRQPAQFAPALSLALGEALSRALHGSSSTGAEALTEVAVEGDADGVLSELDKLVSSEGVSAKEVADAAVALTYLQVKGNRRIWGKVVEKAGALKASFDAASLTSLLWALTTAGVEHFKTVAELAGTAAALAKSLTPAQLSVVVEALGRAGVNDAELHGKISDAVTSKVGDFKPAELARILYGYAAAGVTDAKLAKAVGAALAAKAGELGSREAAQGLWALATLGRLDKPVVDALTKALKSKLSGAESAADAAAGAWALGQLGVKDPATGKALGDALKAGVADLSATQAVQAALGLGLLGSADAAAVGALLSSAAAVVDKAPTSALEPAVLAQLHAAAALTPEAKLPAGVAAYAEKAFGLTVDAARIARPGYASCFVEDVADAVALATGARYRPEVAAAKKGFARPAPDGSLVEIVVDADASTKLAILPIDASHLTTTAPPTLLGSALALARVREAQGYKVVPISAAGWEGDAKAKAGLVLQAIRRAVPALSAKVDTYAKKLAEPFDPYA